MTEAMSMKNYDQGDVHGKIPFLGDKCLSLICLLLAIAPQTWLSQPVKSPTYMYTWVMAVSTLSHGTSKNNWQIRWHFLLSLNVSESITSLKLILLQTSILVRTVQHSTFHQWLHSSR